MSIYAISDLHLSFNADKPMDIFGWQDYENKIKEDWESKVKEDDLVILGGDFSWSMQLQDTFKDFEFIHNLFILLIKVSHTVNFRTPRRITFFNFFDRDHVRFLVMRVEI